MKSNWLKLSLLLALGILPVTSHAQNIVSGGASLCSVVVGAVRSLADKVILVTSPHARQDQTVVRATIRQIYPELVTMIPFLETLNLTREIDYGNLTHPRLWGRYRGNDDHTYTLELSPKVGDGQARLIFRNFLPSLSHSKIKVSEYVRLIENWFGLKNRTESTGRWEGYYTEYRYDRVQSSFFDIKIRLVYEGDRQSVEVTIESDTNLRSVVNFKSMYQMLVAEGAIQARP